MTKDVIELAREAVLVERDHDNIEVVTLDDLPKFAALVAARERERIAQLCESEWSNIAEKMYGAQLAAAIRALNTEGDVNDPITG